MNKWLAIVLLALSVLTGAMGLKALSTKTALAEVGSPYPRIGVSTPAEVGSPYPR